MSLPLLKGIELSPPDDRLCDGCRLDSTPSEDMVNLTARCFQGAEVRSPQPGKSLLRGKRKRWPVHVWSGWGRVLGKEQPGLMGFSNIFNRK